MNYSQLSEKYFVIVKITRQNKTIAVCKDKITSLYDFFEVKKDLYAKVDIKLENQLREVYKNKKPTDFYLKNNNNDKNNVNLCNLNKILPDCKKSLFYAFEGLDNENILKCNHNLNSVIFNFQPIYEHLTTAYYLPTTHSITIGSIPSNKYSFQHMLNHELLHACTKNSDATGIVKILTPNDHSNYISSVVVGMGLNEAITDYIAYECTKKFITQNNIYDNPSKKFLNNSVSAYDKIVNIYYSLIKNVDKNTCIKYYFNSDLNGFINYINNQYYLNDNDKLISLIYKMDTYLDILSAPKYKEKNKDIKKLEFEMYKDYVDIMLHKFTVEKKDLSTVNFEDIISNYRLFFTENQFQFYFNSIKVYLELKKYNQKATSNLNFEDDAKEMCNLLIKASQGQQYSLNKKFLNKQFFSKLFSNNVVVQNINEYLIGKSYLSSKDIHKQSFINIFDSTYFLANKQKKYEILDYLFQNKKQIPFDICNCLNTNQIADLISKDSKMIKYFAIYSLDKMQDVLQLIDTNTKLSPDFYSAIKDITKVMYLENLSYIDFLKAYYMSFPLDIRANKMLSGDICVFLFNNFVKDERIPDKISKFLAEIKKDEQKFAQENGSQLI